VQIRVYYEDTDAGGIVYHSRYLNFCERARSEIFFLREKSPIPEANSGFVVKNINAEFLKPCRLGDLLYVETKLKEIKKASAILEQKIFCNEVEVFCMEIKLVYLKGLKPSKIPQESIEILRSLE